MDLSNEDEHTHPTHISPNYFSHLHNEEIEEGGVDQVGEYGETQMDEDYYGDDYTGEAEEDFDETDLNRNISEFVRGNDVVGEEGDVFVGEDSLERDENDDSFAFEKDDRIHFSTLEGGENEYFSSYERGGFSGLEGGETADFSRLEGGEMDAPPMNDVYDGEMEEDQESRRERNERKRRRKEEKKLRRKEKKLKRKLEEKRRRRDADEGADIQSSEDDEEEKKKKLQRRLEKSQQRARDRERADEFSAVYPGVHTPSDPHHITSDLVGPRSVHVAESLGYSERTELPISESDRVGNYSSELNFEGPSGDVGFDGGRGDSDDEDEGLGRSAGVYDAGMYDSGMYISEMQDREGVHTAEEENFFSGFSSSAGISGSAKTAKVGSASRGSTQEGQPSYFDEVVEKLKQKKKRGRNLTPEESSEFIQNVLTQMREAYEADEVSQNESKPAVMKLQVLDHICAQLVKPKWRDLFLAEGCCQYIADWLTLTKGEKLPNLTLRNKLLQVVHKLPIQTSELQTSQLGYTLLTLWRHPDETNENRTLIEDTVRKWTRPLLGLQYTNRDLTDEHTLAQKKQSIPLIPPTQTTEEDTDKYRHARRPQILGFNFTIPPRSDIPLDHSEHKKKVKGPLNRLLDLQRSTKVPRQAQQVSIEGRDLH